MCTADSTCEGELEGCRKEVRKEEECPSGFTRCLHIGSMEGGNGTNSIPGQCIEIKQQNDSKENNCLDRSDEDPFQEADIDNASLNNFIDQSGDPRLKCSSGKEDCIPLFRWCTMAFRYSFVRECPVLGVGVLTTDPKLCSNISFWRKQTCGKSCTDGSDKYRPIKQLAEAKEVAEAYGGINSQPKVWKTRPFDEWSYNEFHKRREEGAKYKKDNSSGLWMIPE